MQVTATKLRKNIYQLLDKVAETGIPIKIQRNGKTLKIIMEKKSGKLSNLRKHNVLNCKPEELLNLDWSGEWHEEHI